MLQSVYCSADCQRSAWPLHKRICGSDTHIGQLLLFQKAWVLVASGFTSSSLTEALVAELSEALRPEHF